MYVDKYLREWIVLEATAPTLGREGSERDAIQGVANWVEFES